MRVKLKCLIKALTLAKRKASIKALIPDNQTNFKPRIQDSKAQSLGYLQKAKK